MRPLQIHFKKFSSSFYREVLFEQLLLHRSFVCGKSNSRYTSKRTKQVADDENCFHY